MGLEGPCASRAILWRPGSRNGVINSPSLYWVPRSQCPCGEGVVAYSTDDKMQFMYEPFNQGRDFGPLDIARTVMYCRWVDALCTAHAGCSALVHVVSDTSGRDRANTVALCGAFLVLCTGASAEDAFRPFASVPLPGFVDCRGEAIPGAEISEEDDADFTISVLDVLHGLVKARDLGWVDYKTFDVEDHSSSLRPERGDLSWLIPGRALALASPWAEPQDQDGLPVCTPALLCPYFLRNRVSLVVQCNNPEREEEGPRRRLLCYNAKGFRDIGVEHVCMPFEDGGCPSVDIILQFLARAEAVKGAFAVHCRSGLGRTATLIGAYALRHLGFTARGFIGWARCMRPGTVHGSQQQYLVALEPYLRQGAPRKLEDLDERERLTLLPRRELRFWALDSGIPAHRTRLSKESELVEMILTARGVRLPLASPAKAAMPARSLVGVLRQPAQVANPLVASTPKIPPKQLSAPSRLGQTIAKAPAVKQISSENNPPLAQISGSSDNQLQARPKVDPNGPPNGRIADVSVNGLNNISQAIASLGSSLNGKPTLNGKVQNEQEQKKITVAPISSNPNSLSSRIAAHSPKAGDNLVSAKSTDEWAEVLRYLHLFTAMQAGNAWEGVREMVEQLRESSKTPPSVKPETTGKPCNANSNAEAAALRDAHLEATRQVSETQNELRILQQQSESLQRETAQLREKFIRDRDAQLASQTKMENRSEALTATLQADEARLEHAVREVEELRGHVLKEGGLEQWQVDRVEQLRRDISDAREATSKSGSQCRELRARLETMSGGAAVDVSSSRIGNSNIEQNSL